MITLWWIYRGLKRGLYPALNIFLMFFIPLLVTLNYYDLTFSLVGKIAPSSSPQVRETISFCATYFVSLGICVYFVLWLCSGVMKLHTAIDTVGGGIFGLATGIVSTGVLIMFWFAMPFAEKMFPISDRTLLYPANRLALQGATFIANRPLMRNNERPFNGERFMRDLRYGLPSIPTVGAGFYVASIPNGLRIYIDTSGYSPTEFLKRIKERLANPDKDIPPSEKKRPFREGGLTPNFIEDAGQGALVAVINDRVPAEVRSKNADAMFVFDGEIYYSKEMIGDQALFIKIYQVPRVEQNVGSIIALFQPVGAKPEEMAQYLPTTPCFKFDEETLKNELIQNGATEMEAKDAIIPQLRFGGKAWFLGLQKEPMIVEMQGGGKWKITAAPAPDLEAAAQMRSRMYWSPPEN